MSSRISNNFITDLFLHCILSEKCSSSCMGLFEFSCTNFEFDSITKYKIRYHQIQHYIRVYTYSFNMQAGPSSKCRIFVCIIISCLSQSTFLFKYIVYVWQMHGFDSLSSWKIRSFSIRGEYGKEASRVGTVRYHFTVAVALSTRPPQTFSKLLFLVRYQCLMSTLDNRRGGWGGGGCQKKV